MSMAALPIVKNFFGSEPNPDPTLDKSDLLCNISNTRASVSSGYPITEKRVENTTGSGLFSTKFEVFG